MSRYGVVDEELTSDEASFLTFDIALERRETARSSE